MTIQGAHEDIYKRVRTAVVPTLGELQGKRGGLDIASLALNAWRNDAPDYFRHGETAGSYRGYLSRHISRFSQLLGDEGTLVVLIDGARLPAHMRREKVAHDRAQQPRLSRARQVRPAREGRTPSTAYVYRRLRRTRMARA